jgi:hypothetical protein
VLNANDRKIIMSGMHGFPVYSGHSDLRHALSTRDAPSAAAVGYCRLPRTKEAVRHGLELQFEKEDGTVTASRGLPKETFSSQGDAESWLGENWRELLEGGVEQVTLLEEGRVEYGPMSLRPAS